MHEKPLATTTFENKNNINGKSFMQFMMFNGVFVIVIDDHWHVIQARSVMDEIIRDIMLAREVCFPVADAGSLMISGKENFMGLPLDAIYRKLALTKNSIDVNRALTMAREILEENPRVTLERTDKYEEIKSEDQPETFTKID